MGCDIHTIVEIKKDGKWEYVNDLPDVFDSRHYNLFSMLSSTVRRGSFDDGFEPKGLPKDLSGRRFRFTSYMPSLEKMYESGKALTCWIEKEKKWVSPISDSLRESIDKELYDNITQNPTEETLRRYYIPTKTASGKYYVYDAQKVGGIFIEKLFRDMFLTISDFNETYYHYPWHEAEQDYGYYDVDFDDKDYHSHSFLTLTELNTKVSTISSDRSFVVDNGFLDCLVSEIGELPETIVIKKIDKNTSNVSFTDEPDLLYAKECYNDGVSELHQIKEKYNIESDDDIRIVFAFDS